MSLAFFFKVKRSDFNSVTYLDLLFMSIPDFALNSLRALLHGITQLFFSGRRIISLT